MIKLIMQLRTLIEREVHLFLYKWRNQFNICSKSDMTLQQFMSKHTKEMQTYTIDKHISVSNNEYDMYTSKPVIHNTNTVNIPDILVCENLCYPDDECINIIGFFDSKVKSDGYVVITKFGSVLIAFRHDIKIIRYGIIQYEPIFIKLLERISAIDSMETILNILHEIDAMSTQIILLRHARNS